MEGIFLIKKYFPEITSQQENRFVQMNELYQHWNSRINVISRKDMDNFYERHVLHSLSIARIIKFKAFTNVMDAGTGGGFPGIPLAIMFPKVNFYLVDSIRKKIKVVKEVVKELKLNNIVAEQVRIEQVNRRFDFVISRAVTDLETFTHLTLNNIHSKSVNDLPNGILYLKGINIKDEIYRTEKIKKIKIKTYPLRDIFEEKFFITKQIVFLNRS